MKPVSWEQVESSPQMFAKYKMRIGCFLSFRKRHCVCPFHITLLCLPKTEIPEASFLKGCPTEAGSIFNDADQELKGLRF